MADVLLFDLDGTLIDSEPWHKKAEIQAFGVFGLNLDTDELARYVGSNLDSLLRGVGDCHGLWIDRDEFLKVEIPILGDYIQSEIQLFAETPKFLEASKDNRTGLVTSSPTWYVDAVRNRFPELFERFEVVVDGDGLEFGKPHPEPYTKACRLLDVPPTSCVVFEDSINGVASAHAAGCRAIRIDRSLTDEDESELVWRRLSIPRLDRLLLEGNPPE